jgi:hypothetical protein
MRHGRRPYYLAEPNGEFRTGADGRTAGHLSQGWMNFTFDGDHPPPRWVKATGRRALSGDVWRGSQVG